MLPLRTPISCLLLLLANVGNAEEAPSYDFSTLDVGAIFRWETSAGPSIGENLGFLGETYVFEAITELENGETLYNRSGATVSGQMVWRENNYESYYLIPHDCSFVLGQCQAQMYSNSTLYADMEVEASYSDGIWTHIETTRYIKGQEKTLYYCGIYDAHAISIALYMTDGTGSEYRERIVSGPDAARSAAALERVTSACQKFQRNP